MSNMDHKKGADPSKKDCAYCETSEAKLTCGKCKAAHYCSKACQKQHWKNGHKEECVKPADRRPALQPDARAPEAQPTSGDECAICLEPLTPEGSLTLGCSHVFHSECVGKLRKLGAKSVCPLCRGELPPGPEQTFYAAHDRYVVLVQRVAHGKASWGALTETEQLEMKELIRLFLDAAGQGHDWAQFTLGSIYENGQGTKESLTVAVKWYRKSAEQGFPVAQHVLGLLHSKGEGVAQSNVEAFKWLSKAAKQGVRNAQYDLGVSYKFGHGTKEDSGEL